MVHRREELLLQRLREVSRLALLEITEHELRSGTRSAA